MDTAESVGKQSGKRLNNNNISRKILFHRVTQMRTGLKWPRVESNGMCFKNSSRR
jgi:hypothetical protein